MPCSVARAESTVLVMAVISASLASGAVAIEITAAAFVDNSPDANALRPETLALSF